MPWGRLSWRRKRVRISGGMPVSVSDRMPEDWSSRRITTDSPYCTGMVEIRTSTSRPRTFMLKRPSWGRRFSEMSSPATSLRRSTSAWAMRTSLRMFSWRMPSIRWRIRSTFSSGSIWISDAPTCTASSNRERSSLATVASPSSAPALRLLAPSSKPVSWYSSCNCSAKLSISRVRR